MKGEKVDIPYTLDDMADDAAGLLDALGIPRAHICGMSMGGRIAQAMVIRHPSRVLSLISIYAKKMTQYYRTALLSADSAINPIS